ncbi:MAG: phytanoyl-CoA dioxygenase family protein [Thiolinea sp.]
MADHNGAALSGVFEEAEALLATYANMQGQAVNMPQLLAELPKVSPDSLYVGFMEFLNNDSPLYKSGGQVQAGYFLGQQESANYHQLFLNRIHWLQSFANQAMVLPTTLNHGDLRLPNAALKQHGITLFDWDEACAGPAGLSLYSLFGGCAPLFLLTNAMQAYASETESQQFSHLFKHYADTLAGAGYGDTGYLHHALAAASCLGVMRYLVSFADYVVPDENQRQLIADNIRGSLDDLLTLCDYLVLQSQQAPLAYVQDYLETGYWPGVENTLKNYLKSAVETEGTPAIGKTLLNALLSQGKSEEAEILLDELLKQTTRDADLFYLRGNLFARKREYQQALHCYAKAAAYSPGRADIRQSMELAKYLQQIVQYAAVDTNAPTIELPLDWQQQTESGFPEQLSQLGTALFDQYGALVIRNLFPASLIAELRDAFNEGYGDKNYRNEDRGGPALSVGDKRKMLSIEVEGVFNHPGIYGSPFLLSLLSQLFNGEFILGSYTAVTALPGAGEQHLHKDRENLFPEQATPCFAATLLIPLIPTNPETGGTRIYKNSQNLSLEASLQLPFQEVFANPGDCLLFDYRLSHQGMENISTVERPVLSLVYQRPWFRDIVNFSQQPPMRLKQKEYDAIPPNLKALFASQA